MTVDRATENLRLLTTRPGGSGWLLRLLLAIETWLYARASRRALSRLDSRELADIGLTEADLGRVDPAVSWRSLLLLTMRR